MGLLTNYFAATTVELDEMSIEDGPFPVPAAPSTKPRASGGLLGLFRRAPAPGPVDQAPVAEAAALPAFASNGIDAPAIALLDALMTGVRFRDEDWQGAEMPSIRDLGKNGPWIFALRREFRDAVSAIDDAPASDLAARWAANSDWMGDTEAESVQALREFIRDLRSLARTATQTRRDLYLWMSI